jgi:hypothetical protein
MLFALCYLMSIILNCSLRKRMSYVRFEILTAVTMKNVNSWDVRPCGFYVSVFLRSVLQCLITANVVHSLVILFTLMMEAICSSEMSVLNEPHGVTNQKMAFFMTNLQSWNSPGIHF